MKKVSKYLLFTVLLFIVILDFTIDVGDRLDTKDGWEIHFGDIPTKVPGIGLSSGFIIHPSGDVLANDHVTEYAEQIVILTSNGINYGLTVVACDPACDLVLLKVEVLPGREFRALPMVDPDVIEAGDADCSVPSRWVRELLDEIRSDKVELKEPER
jgi:S1-C subfamily serine protease